MKKIILLLALLIILTACSNNNANFASVNLALRPHEEIKIENFIASMDGETLMDAIKNQSHEEVLTSIPKFQFEYDEELSETLKELGMVDAFDGDKADFSALAHSGEGNICIGHVLHKTKIQVHERGTKAGAATAVEMVIGSVAPLAPKTVNLDRPFFFMIVDNEYNMPIFMGVLNDITQ